MKRFLLVLTTSCLLATHTVAAEFHCSQEVSYKWKQEKAESETTVLFSNIEAKGLDELTAKQALNQKLSSEKARAIESCKAKHENLAACIKGKLISSGTTLQALGFNARKTLEDSIVADCKNLFGSCSSSINSEPVCREIVVAAAATEAENSKEAEKSTKDKKKK